jgi:hypothetical protein
MKAVRPGVLTDKAVIRDILDRLGRLERPARSIVLSSPDGNRWRVTVDNGGNVIATAL